LGLIVGIQYQSASSTARTYLWDLIGLCMGDPLGSMEMRPHGSVSHVMGKIPVHPDPVSTHGRSPFQRIVVGASDSASQPLDRRNLSRPPRSKRHTRVGGEEGCPGGGGGGKSAEGSVSSGIRAPQFPGISRRRRQEACPVSACGNPPKGGNLSQRLVTATPDPPGMVRRKWVKPKGG